MAYTTLMMESAANLLPLEVLAVESPIGLWSVSTQNGQVVSVDHVGPDSDTSLRMTPETKLEQQLACMLSRYFKGDKVDFERIPIALPMEGRFLNDVLTALQRVPYGETRDYGWLAREIGKPKAARAVGGALGRNPIPILVPCHRIITRDGLLGGFMRDHPAGGRIKEFLLALEGLRFNKGRLVVSGSQLLN